MKFTYTGSGLNNYYGITAGKGDKVEAKEEWLITKMINHPDFKEAATKKAAKKED